MALKLFCCSPSRRSWESVSNSKRVIFEQGFFGGVFIIAIYLAVEYVHFGLATVVFAATPVNNIWLFF